MLILKIRSHTFDPDLIEIVSDAAPAQYAHFFSKTARKPAELVLSDGPALNGHTISIPVSGKREAATIASQCNAIRWNF